MFHFKLSATLCGERSRRAGQIPLSKQTGQSLPRSAGPLRAARPSIEANVLFLRSVSRTARSTPKEAARGRCGHASRLSDWPRYAASAAYFPLSGTGCAHHRTPGVRIRTAMGSPFSRNIEDEPITRWHYIGGSSSSTPTLCLEIT